jgi:hypothetical protein
MAETRQPYVEFGEMTKQHQSGRGLNDFVRVLYKKTAIVTLSDGLLRNGFGKVGTAVLFFSAVPLGQRSVAKFYVAVLRPGVAAKDPCGVGTAYSVP